MWMAKPKPKPNSDSYSYMTDCLNVKFEQNFLEDTQLFRGLDKFELSVQTNFVSSNIDTSIVRDEFNGGNSDRISQGVVGDDLENVQVIEVVYSPENIEWHRLNGVI